jgi:hypothetical protein
MLLAAVLVPCAAYASPSSSDQFVLAQVGTTERANILVSPNPTLAGAPECNTTRSYVFKGR